MKTFVITLPMRKPRNPFVVASLRRSGGSHRPTAGAPRRLAKAALRRELEQPNPSP